jgi:predicted helicase
MMNLFGQIVRKCRDISFSKRDKGYHLERLILSCFKTYPLYEGEFSTAWLWNEPLLKRDFGIDKKDLSSDLAIYTKCGDCLVIQYRCYKKYATIDKPNVDSLLSTSTISLYDILETGRKVNFAYRLNKYHLKRFQSENPDRRTELCSGVEIK